jgi:hypothetical protein
MQYRVLYDFAINTGMLYPQHCQMARDGASHRVWELHVRSNVLHSYRRDCNEPYEGMSKGELSLCAKELMDYYRQHLDESDAQ